MESEAGLLGGNMILVFTVPTVYAEEVKSDCTSRSMPMAPRLLYKSLRDAQLVQGVWAQGGGWKLHLEPRPPGT